MTTPLLSSSDCDADNVSTSSFVFNLVDFPVVHEMPPTSKLPGIKATLFVNPPPDQYTNFEVHCNTAYLVESQPDQPNFDSFDDSFCKSLDLPIPIYLEILEFFESSWPAIERNLEKQMAKLMKIPLPECNAPGIYINMNSVSVDYENWFDDVYLGYRKYNNNSRQSFTSTIHIQKGATSIEVDPKQMKKLAATQSKLIMSLHRAGYKFPTLNEMKNENFYSFISTNQFYNGF